MIARQMRVGVVAMMSSPDPESVREALAVPARPLGHGADVPPDMRGMYALPLSVIDARTEAARAWLAGSPPPDYEAALKVLIAEDVHEASGLTMTGVRKAVDAAFPGLFEERP